MVDASSGGHPPRPAYRLGRDLVLAMYEHARSEFPRECCGYVLGDRLDPENLRLVVCSNAQDIYHARDPIAYPRTAVNAYAFGGRELLDLTFSFDGPNPAVVIYHSHPRAGAYFSREDIGKARATGYPVDYLVIGIQDNGVDESRMYRWRRDDAFDEIATYPGAPI